MIKPISILKPCLFKTVYSGIILDHLNLTYEIFLFEIIEIAVPKNFILL